MREDDATTAVPEHQGEPQQNEQSQQGDAADPATEVAATVEAEKPKRRPARRRSTSAAGKPPAESEVAADTQPGPGNVVVTEVSDAGPRAGGTTSGDEKDEPLPEQTELAVATAEPASAAVAESVSAPEPEAEPKFEAEPETEEDGVVGAIAAAFMSEPQTQSAFESEVQPFVTSLAPQLSHVDAGQAEVELAPPAAFNPFALFQAPEEVVRPAPLPARAERTDDSSQDAKTTDDSDESDDDSSDDDDDSGSRRRRRGRRGRGRRPGDNDDNGDDGADESASSAKQSAQGSDDKQQADDKQQSSDRGENRSQSDNGSASDSADDENESGSRRRRRRRRRGGDSDNESGGSNGSNGSGRSSGSGSESSDSGADKVRGVSGSVRLEAKRQRRKEGRDHGRRRAPILTEAEFLARREAVTRKMIVRQQGERIQIAVLEDDVLVEHYVTLASEQSFAGGVYLGRVQNVLPSMEAAFIDIGKRRNAVLYAGEVNWDAAGLAGKQRNIEQALKSGDKVLVQVTKDPIGHKGARLTSQISLPGRYLVYVPSGSMTGISRKLPEQERSRLKEILRRIVPDNAGVIIRTAAEGATEEELSRDVQRLQAQWEVIEKKAADSNAKAPSVLYEEPDLAIRVVRDLFNEDFAQMVVSGDDAWNTLSAYIQQVAPDLVERVSKSEPNDDVFKEYRIDEQLTKALDRKVWLPSGGSLVIDRTEAMTVIDVNTGKFTGSGGNLEQTVTKNNLEAAEEIVRQLRLRDIGGIVVIDFIDMLLESNRELVLRRLTECLGRDRTKHQVAEVTSLGLVQMTRKRVGQGLLDAFSETCPHCDGRGIIVHSEPIEKKTASTGTEPTSRRNSRSRRGSNRDQQNDQENNEPRRDSTSQLSVIAAALHKDEASDAPADQTVGEQPATAEPAAPRKQGGRTRRASRSAQTNKSDSAQTESNRPDQRSSKPDQSSEPAHSGKPEQSIEPAHSGKPEQSSEPAQSGNPAPDKDADSRGRASAPASQPGGDQGAAGQPSVVQPSVVQPSVDQPSVGQPSVDQSSVDQSGVDQTSTESTERRPAVRRRRAARRPAGPPSPGTTEKV